MTSDIWLRTILIVRKETCCRHMGYSFRSTARVLLYASFHRQDSTYHGLCYTSREALAGTRNSSMGPHHEGSIRRPIAPWATSRSPDLKQHISPHSDSCTKSENVSKQKNICQFTNTHTHTHTHTPTYIRKEMFYLMMHSTHFILRLFGVGHRVKDHSDSEREETCCRHYMGYSFWLAARSLICIIP